MLDANTTLLRLQLSPMDGIDLPDMQAITAILHRNNVSLVLDVAVAHCFRVHHPLCLVGILLRSGHVAAAD